MRRTFSQLSNLSECLWKMGRTPARPNLRAQKRKNKKPKTTQRTKAETTPTSNSATPVQKLSKKPNGRQSCTDLQKVPPTPRNTFWRPPCCGPGPGNPLELFGGQLSWVDKNSPKNWDRPRVMRHNYPQNRKETNGRQRCTKSQKRPHRGQLPQRFRGFSAAALGFEPPWSPRGVVLDGQKPAKKLGPPADNATKPRNGGTAKERQAARLCISLRSGYKLYISSHFTQSGFMLPRIRFQSQCYYD